MDGHQSEVMHRVEVELSLDEISAFRHLASELGMNVVNLIELVVRTYNQTEAVSILKYFKEIDAVVSSVEV